MPKAKTKFVCLYSIQKRAFYNSVSAQDETVIKIFALNKDTLDNTAKFLCYFCLKIVRYVLDRVQLH